MIAWKTKRGGSRGGTESKGEVRGGRVGEGDLTKLINVLVGYEPFSCTLTNFQKLILLTEIELLCLYMFKNETKFGKKGKGRKIGS